MITVTGLFHCLPITYRLYTLRLVKALSFLIVGSQSLTASHCFSLARRLSHSLPISLSLFAVCYCNPISNCQAIYLMSREQILDLEMR